MNKRLGAGLACAGLLIFSTQALAWGDRERAALWGVVGGVVLANAWNSSPQQPQAREYPAVTVYSPPARVYEYHTVYTPAPRYVADNPYAGNGGAHEAYQRGRIDRQRDRQARLEQEAYERGYRGSWGDWR